MWPHKHTHNRRTHIITKSESQILKHTHSHTQTQTYRLEQQRLTLRDSLIYTHTHTDSPTLTQTLTHFHTNRLTEISHTNYIHTRTYTYSLRYTHSHRFTHLGTARVVRACGIGKNLLNTTRFALIWFVSHFLEALSFLLRLWTNI